MTKVNKSWLLNEIGWLIGIVFSLAFVLIMLPVVIAIRIIDEVIYRFAKRKERR